MIVMLMLVVVVCSLVFVWWMLGCWCVSVDGRLMGMVGGMFGSVCGVVS